MGDYRELKVWRRAHEITLEIYRCTHGFPVAEKFGLTAQLRSAASSIPANIAEGTGRNSENELARFCRISLGSAAELEYHLLLAHDLGYIDKDAYLALSESVDHVKRMLVNLIAVITRKRQPRTSRGQRNG